MTSNIGSEHFKKILNPLGFMQSQSASYKDIEKSVLSEFTKRFSPEFINRIDEVVVFSPLTRLETEQVAIKLIKEVVTPLEKIDKKLTISPEALAWIAEKGYSLTYGARHMKRFIDEIITIPLSEIIDQSKEFSLVEKVGGGMKLVPFADKPAVLIDLDTLKAYT